MADREIIRPPFKQDFPQITEAGYRYLQQIAEAINLIRGGTTHGTGTDYLQIEKDGTIVAKGAATCWRDENFSGVLTAIGASAPTMVAWSPSTVLIPQFQHTLTKELNINREYDHAGIVPGALYVHVHIYPTVTANGTAKFFCEYIIKKGSNVAVTGTLNSTIDLTGITAWDEVKANIGLPISSELLSQGTQIGLRLYRLSTDPGTYTNPVAVSTWGYHYEVDMLGSREITTK